MGGFDNRAPFVDGCVALSRAFVGPTHACMHDRESLDPHLNLWLRGGSGDIGGDLSVWHEHRGQSYHAGTDATVCTGLTLDADDFVYFKDDNACVPCAAALRCAVLLYCVVM